ncbi:MAG: carboxypeptidase-like regulatory domain-containing protein [Planctomycetota bacterium]|nr:carboxypeptidase-like regulatory domain-containing protein [Planctomycetota bacterium]
MDERELVEHAGFLQNLARRLLADEHLDRDAVQDAYVAALEGIAGGDADARIALPVGADIRGTVRVPAGVYVSGRTVLAVQTEDGSIVPRGEIAATTPTERDGTFRLVALPRGPLRDSRSSTMTMSRASSPDPRESVPARPEWS